MYHWMRYSKLYNGAKYLKLVLKVFLIRNMKTLK